MLATMLLGSAVICGPSIQALQEYRAALGTATSHTFHLSGRGGDAYGTSFEGTRTPSSFENALAGPSEIHRANGLDADGYWAQNWDGFVGDARGNESRVERGIWFVVSGHFAWLQSTDAGCRNVGDEILPTRLFTDPGGADVLVAFSKDGKAVRAAWVAPDAANIAMTDIAYIATPYGKIVGSWTAAGLTISYQRATSVPDETLSRPPQRASDLAGPITLPVRRERNRQALTIVASINGHVGRFLFDSGANMVILNSGFAENAGLVPLGESGAYGIGGFERSSLFRVDVTVGSLTMHNLVAQSAFETFGLDGFIGSPLFYQGRASIDVSHNSARLEPSEPMPMGKPLDTYSSAPVVPGEANGIPVDFVLDTGSEGGFLLPVRYQRLVGGKEVNGICAMTGRDPFHDPLRYEFDVIRLLDLGFTNVDACVDVNPEFLFRNSTGIAGFETLRGSTWILDYRAGLVSHVSM
jgi:hypothetical protein